MKDLMKKYEALTEFVEEEGGEGYYLSYLPAFGGWEPCSGVGDTREESVRELELVMEDIFLYYREKGKEFPKPGKIHIVSGSLCDYFSGGKERIKGLTKND